MNAPEFVVAQIADKARLLEAARRRKMNRLVRKSADGFVAALRSTGGAPIMITVGGYDDDPRELCDIPEACDFLLAFAEEMQRRQVPTTRILDQALELIRTCQAKKAGIPVHFLNPSFEERSRQLADSVVATKKRVQ